MCRKGRKLAKLNKEMRSNVINFHLNREKKGVKDIMKNIEKNIMKIKNLLDLANNNPNENEALAASLKAQELLVKYNIEMADVEDAVFFKGEIVEQEANLGKSQSKKWGIILASAIAKNFYCKVFTTTSGKSKQIFFYGYHEDVKVAIEVFETLFSIGNKLARKKYYEYRKAGKCTKGITNAYLYGFVEGIKEALEKQSTALMVVTPKEVNEAFAEKIAGPQWRSSKTSLKFSTDAGIRKAGREDGRQAIAARAIRG